MLARFHLTYANVIATIALFIAIGGASAFAASQFGKNTVGTSQIKNNSVTKTKIKKNAVVTAKIRGAAVTTKKIKNDAVTGAKVNESSLSTVPSAQVANTLLPSEEWHPVGARGEPPFEGTWRNLVYSASDIHGIGGNDRAAFLKDSAGVVYLKGDVTGGPSPSGPVFTLPSGYVPNNNEFLVPVLCPAPSCTSTVVPLVIQTRSFQKNAAAYVEVLGGNSAILDGVSFPAWVPPNGS